MFLRLFFGMVVVVLFGFLVSDTDLIWATYVWGLLALLTLGSSNSEKGELGNAHMGIIGYKTSWAVFAAACSPALVILVAGTTRSMVPYGILMAALFLSPSLWGMVRMDQYRRFTARSIQKEKDAYFDKRRAVLRDLAVFSAVSMTAFLFAFSYLAASTGWQGVVGLSLLYLMVQRIYVSRADYRLAEPKVQKSIGRAWKGGVILILASLGVAAFVAMDSSLNALTFWVAMAFVGVAAIGTFVQAASPVVERDEEIKKLWVQEGVKSDTEKEMEELVRRMEEEGTFKGVE